MNGNGRRVSSLFGVLAVAAIGCTTPADSPSGPQSRYAPFGELRVHYQEQGSGEDVLVCVHGWASDATVWEGQWPLSSDWRLLLVDLPGHGQSDEPEGNPGEVYTMDFFANSVAAVLDDAGVERAFLMGHSNGTPVIRQFYRRHSERTRGLIVVDGALHQVMPPEFQEQMLAQFRSPAFLNNPEPFLLPLLSSLPPRFQESVKAMMLRTTPEAMLGGMEAAADPGIWGDDPVLVPTLCMMAKSPFWTPEYEDAVRRLVPGVDYRVLDGVSHFLHMEVPEQFNGAVREFLGK